MVRWQIIYRLIIMIELVLTTVDVFYP